MQFRKENRRAILMLMDSGGLRGEGLVPSTEPHPPLRIVLDGYLPRDLSLRNDDLDRPITYGPSANTDEMCIMPNLCGGQP